MPNPGFAPAIMVAFGESLLISSYAFTCPCTKKEPHYLVLATCFRMPVSKGTKFKGSSVIISHRLRLKIYLLHAANQLLLT